MWTTASKEWIGFLGGGWVKDGSGNGDGVDRFPR